MTPRLPVSAALGLLALLGLVACSPDATEPTAEVPRERPITATLPPTEAPEGTQPAPSATPTSALAPPRLDNIATPSPTGELIETGLLRLVDFLDDPLGYCVDVAGFGQNLRLEAPLQAHTCKPRSDDQLFSTRPDGGIVLVEHDRCLGAIDAEASSPVEVVECDPLADVQRFEMGHDGRITLPSTDGSNLCLGVADGAGEPAGGRNHLRRDLLLYRCNDDVETALLEWELVKQ